MVNYGYYLILFLMVSLIVGMAPVASALAPDPYFPYDELMIRFNYTPLGAITGFAVINEITNRGGATTDLPVTGKWQKNIIRNYLFYLKISNRTAMEKIDDITTMFPMVGITP